MLIVKLLSVHTEWGYNFTSSKGNYPIPSIINPPFKAKEFKSGGSRNILKKFIVPPIEFHFPKDIYYAVLT